MRWLVALFVVLWAHIAPTSALAQEAVFVVRHTERADSSSDPPLSTAGIERAARLAAVLQAAGITQVYTSNLRRTRDTAAPLAKTLQLTPTELPANDFDALIAKLRTATRQDRVLIVGHSNTVPEILKRLGITTPVTIADSEHDNLFLVIPQTGATPIFVPLKY